MNIQAFAGQTSLRGQAVLEKHLCIDGMQVISVACSGIAAMLLPYNRTVHSRFKLSLKHVHSVAGLKVNSKEAAIIRFAKLIIWDEALMAKKHCVLIDYYY